jgi:hypothetical protein
MVTNWSVAVCFVLSRGSDGVKSRSLGNLAVSDHFPIQFITADNSPEDISNDTKFRALFNAVNV